MPDDCCKPGEGCRSPRLRDRVQVRFDNTAFHHRWVANGPLWPLCPTCRELRRDQPERTWTLLQRALTPTGRPWKA